MFIWSINAFLRYVTFSERQEDDDVMRWEFPFEWVTKLLLFLSHVTVIWREVVVYVVEFFTTWFSSTFKMAGSETGLSDLMDDLDLGDVGETGGFFSWFLKCLEATLATWDRFVTYEIKW